MDLKHWRHAFREQWYAHSPISLWVEYEITVAISIRYVTVPSIHLVVLERRGWEGKIEEWFRVVFHLTLRILNGWTDRSIKERVGVDFAEFALGFVESEVKCGDRISWRDRLKGSVDHFQWESVEYELETGSGMWIIHNTGISGKTIVMEKPVAHKSIVHVALTGTIRYGPLF